MLSSVGRNNLPLCGLKNLNGVKSRSYLLVQPTTTLVTSFCHIYGVEAFPVIGMLYRYTKISSLFAELKEFHKVFTWTSDNSVSRVYALVTRIIDRTGKDSEPKASGGSNFSPWQNRSYLP